MTSYAAGVLILSQINNKIYVLLGKDHYNTYSDFGGKNEVVDMNNPIYTAGRELYEETCGSLTSIHENIDFLYKCPVVNSLSYTNKHYFMYVMFVIFEMYVNCLYSSIDICL